jgi:hypothetical protein
MTSRDRRHIWITFTICALIVLFLNIFVVLNI